MSAPPVLLVGAAAEGLASRLRLSGYAPFALDAGGEAVPLDGDGRREPGSAADPSAPAGPAARAPGGPGPATAVAAGRSEPSPGLPALALVVLSPGEEARIPALRARWRAAVILLGIPDDTVEGRSRTLASGADDYWLTALGPSDLLTRARLHLQLSPAPVTPPPTQLELADLLVIPSSRVVMRAGRSLALTAREFQLLLLLLQHCGEVLSREQILQAVWHDQQTAASNVIDVYVRYLRQKLEQAGERRLIHTVRGRGYCLSDGPPQLD